MKILALESYYGGSHKYFIDGLIAGSKHRWTLLTLPDEAWRWRMRHAAAHFASQLKDMDDDFDLIFCSSIMNGAEFRGLAPARFRNIPMVAYFHENQLEYPLSGSRVSTGAVMANFMTALAADQVWFNSQYNRDSFLSGLPDFFSGMPDFHPPGELARIREKSRIMPLFVSCPSGLSEKKTDGPLHILWAARWEQDKNPQDFFRALRILKNKGVDFCLSVIGQKINSSPKIFDNAEAIFADNIVQWGYLPSRKAYFSALSEADVVVSTADHEFFGLSMLEAAACGTRTVLPQRLSYPEIFTGPDGKTAIDFFYGQSSDDLASHLSALALMKETVGDVISGLPVSHREIAARYAPEVIIPTFDRALTVVG